MADRDFHALKRLLQEDPDALLRDWKRLKPMEKAVLFKLMKPKAAMSFYETLSFKEKYFLFSAFDLGAIAPILEDLPRNSRALFHRLPAKYYDAMAEQLK